MLQRKDGVLLSGPSPNNFLPNPFICNNCDFQNFISADTRAQFGVVKPKLSTTSAWLEAQSMNIQLQRLSFIFKSYNLVLLWMISYTSKELYSLACSCNIKT